MTSSPRATPHWATLALALAVLNAWLTLAPIWPTPFIRLSRDVSLELVACVLGLAAMGPVAVARRDRLAFWLAAAWVPLTVGRYAAVMAHALWGRDINLYWDVPHVPAVGAMLAYVATPAVLAGVVTGLIAVPALVFLPSRWAWRRVIDALGDGRLRRALAVACALVVIVGLAQRADERVPHSPGVATPVTLGWARQARQLAYEMSGAGLRALGDPPVVASTLSQVQGADVLLLFVESYGAVSWTRPEFARALAPSRAALEADLRDTGRSVVTAYVESPTFGGESWLAHVSLLSGTEVRDGATNARLLAQRRDTMVTAFSRAGYRTVAIMPGIQSAWNEGAFYGFDDVYGAERLAYTGPSFGWWDITDQFALARLDEREIAPAARPPVFAVFPTISTHTPFIPAPPYQPDWTRVLTAYPYDKAALDAAYAEPADWLNLGPGYVRALAYAHATIGGYLRLRADRDLVVVILGDHQPPALVSGEGASWNVPVHVVASRQAVLDRLVARGFHAGLAPQAPVLSKMHALLPVLLDAFGSTP